MKRIGVWLNHPLTIKLQKISMLRQLRLYVLTIPRSWPSKGNVSLLFVASFITTLKKISSISKYAYNYYQQVLKYAYIFPKDIVNYGTLPL